MLHVVNNLAVPVSVFGSKSVIVWAGVQDAMTQWWYGHNAVGFFLTAGFSGNDVLLRFPSRPNARSTATGYRLFTSGRSSSSTSGRVPHHLHLHGTPRLGLDAWNGVLGGALDAVPGVE